MNEIMGTNNSSITRLRRILSIESKQDG